MTCDHVVLALLFALTLGCDKGADTPPPPVDAGPPPEPATVEETAPKALEVSGSVESKDGAALQWKQTFSGGRVLDLTSCGNRVFGLGGGGRIVEWDPKTLAPKQVLAGFGAVTAIDSNDRTLLAGTADGRLLRSSCEGREPETSPDRLWPVKWVHLDARSKTRAFVIYVESPDQSNELKADSAAVSLVNLETSEMREPFRRAWPAGGTPLGFADYKGELWFGLNRPKARSDVWYLERFDDGQPPLAGLGDEVLHGFIQVSREVWAYGGAVDGKRSLVTRVDTNRAKSMWDGKEGWFGEQPGGDLPPDPIVAMHKQGKEFVIASTNDVFRADTELRRWRKLQANDPIPHVLRRATKAVESGEQVLIGTPHGLVSIQGEAWKRATVPEFTAVKDAGTTPATEVTWRDLVWTATKKGLTSHPADSERARPFKLGPRKLVRGMFVDAADRLWVFADDGAWLLRGTARGEQERFDTAPIGAASRLVSSVIQGPQPDVIIVTTSYGAEFGFRVEAPPVAAEPE